MPSLSEEKNIEDKCKMYTAWAFPRNSLKRKKKKERNYCSQDFPAALVIKTLRKLRSLILGGQKSINKF